MTTTTSPATENRTGSDIAAAAGSAVSSAKETATQSLGKMTDQVAQTIDRFADQADALARGDMEQAGDIGQYAQRASDQLHRIAGDLRNCGVDGIVSDVQRFARTRPIIFLGAAAVAGALVGRALRVAPVALEQATPPGGLMPSGSQQPSSLGAGSRAPDLGMEAGLGATPPVVTPPMMETGGMGADIDLASSEPAPTSEPDEAGTWPAGGGSWSPSDAVR